MIGNEGESKRGNKGKIGRREKGRELEEIKMKGGRIKRGERDLKGHKEHDLY